MGIFFLLVAIDDPMVNCGHGRTAGCLLEEEAY
jgi:hypothetical protein